MPLCPSCSVVELTPLRRGGYLCEDCNGRWDAAAIAAAVARVRPRPKPTALDARLPFPIAHPFAQALDTRLAPEQRLTSAVFAAYQMIRVSSVLLLADYLDTNVPSRKVHLALRAMRAPDWWAWTVLCNQLCRYFLGELDAQPQRDGRFPKLSTGWRSVNRKSASKKDSKWASLLDGLPGRDGPAESANDALWAAREELEARSRVDGGDVEIETVEALLRVLEAALARLFPADNLELLRRVDIRGDVVRVIRLHGPHEDGRFAVEHRDSAWAELLGESGVIALTPSGALVVQPFFLVLDGESRRHAFGGGGMLEPLRVRRKDDEVFVRLESLGGPGRTPPILAPGLAALRADGLELRLSGAKIPPSGVLPWATARLGATLDGLHGRSYFPESYVERKGLDDVFDAALAAPGKAIVLLGEPGSGKTSLLLRAAARAARLDGDRKAVARSSDVVIFASGRAAFAGPIDATPEELLAHAIARQLGVQEELYFSATDVIEALRDESWVREGRRAWILLDGIDQADRGDELFTALENELPLLLAFPWVRVVVTVRTSTYAARATLGNEGALRDPRLFVRFYDPRAEVLVPYLEARPFEPDTQELAYERRQSMDPMRSSPVAFHAIPDDLRQLLSRPLSLHLFHEARWDLEGVGVIRGEQDLVRAHLIVLAMRSPQVEAAMTELGNAMLRHRGSGVPALEGTASRRRSKPEPPVDLGRLEEAGLLVPSVDDAPVAGEKTSCNFAHPSFADELLIAALLRRIAPRSTPSGEDLATWGGLVAGPGPEFLPTFPELARALGVLARRMLAAGDVNQVMWLLTVPDPTSASAILGEGLRVLGSMWGPVASPSEAAQLVLEALETVAADPGLAYLLVRALRPVERWLRAAGYRDAARALERVYLRATRTQIAASPDRADLQEELATSLRELSRLAVTDGDHAEARTYGENALKVRRTLRDLAPADRARAHDLARAVLDLAIIARQGARARDAERLLSEAHALATAAAETEPIVADAVELLADVQYELGSGAREDGDLVEARGRFHDALRLRRRLGTGNPPRDDRLYRLGATLRRLGELELLAGEATHGRRHLEEATSVLRGVTAREPSAIDAHRELSRSLSALGSHARADGRREDARRHYDEALEGARWLAQQATTRHDVQCDLAVALQEAGMLAMLEGKRGRARRMLEEAARVARDLLQSRPGDTDARRALVTALTNLGNVARAEGKHGDARTSFAEATEASEVLLGHTVRPDDVLAVADLYWSASLVEANATSRRESIARVRALLTPLREGPTASPQIERLWDLAFGAEALDIDALTPALARSGHGRGATHRLQEDPTCRPRTSAASAPPASPSARAEDR